MKDIVARTGGDAKLRLRGKGSGYVERDTKEESKEPLQLCISCPSHHGYDIAVRETEDLLLGIYDQHRRFLADRGLPDTTPRIRMSERHTNGEAGGGGDGGGRRQEGSRRQRPPRPRSEPRDEDRGERPDEAPSEDEIERLIEMRNDARRASDYREADRIRADLKDRGVVLSDERGSRGSGATVTSWRYWRK